MGPIHSQVPKLTPEQLKAQEEELNEVNRLPQLPGEPRNAPPVDPPTKANLDKRWLMDSSRKLGPEAANDFTYGIVHDLTPTEASGNRSVIDEPSVANVGNTVFYSGNWYAARSSDGGQSFTYVSPYDTFPSINKGFCCDQIVNYAPNQNMVLWAVQYLKDSTSGTLRIARAIGETAVANNTWTYYDFNPRSFGFATNNWLDFPNMTVSDNYLYVTSNVYSTTNDSFTGSVIWRLSLSALAAGGSLNFSHFTSTNIPSLRCTEGARATMYWGSLLSTTQVRIHRWDDSGANVFWDDVNVNSFIFLNRDGVATSPDGTNWAARADSRILGAWVGGGVIGLMWAAKQGGSFPYPYTIVARFNESNRTLLSQNPIWSPQYAWLYPSASVNLAGHVAGLINFGGGSTYPSTQIFISDDVQNGFNPPALYSAAASNIGPSSNAWGDYHTIRRHKQSPNTWVASTHYVNNTGSNVVPRYLWVGRERDFSVGRPKADFNGDVFPDWGLQKPSTRQIAVWLLTAGPLFSSGSYTPTPPAGWILVDAEEFGAGTTSVDLLLFNPSTRASAIWFMNGNILLQSSYGPSFPAGWNLLFSQDFNSDVKPDFVLYRPATGQTAIWYLNGSLAVTATSYGPTLPSGWIIVGADDFNRDDRPDFLLYKPSTRQTAIWYMNGVQFLSSAFGPTLPVGWTLSAVDDYNRDRKPDLVLTNAGTHQSGIWHLNNNVFLNSVYGPNIPSGWDLRAPK